MTPLKIILVCSMLLCLSSTLSAQENDKKMYIGDYSYNDFEGDTSAGYFFLSIDSFKIIHTIKFNDEKDLASPIGVGTWTMNGEEVALKFNNGVIKKAKFGNGHFTGGDLTGPIPELEFEGRSYSNFLQALKKARTIQ